MADLILSPETCAVKNNTKSRNRYRGMVGEKFHFLTVMSFAGQADDESYTIFWRCRCDCGKEIIASGKRLRRGTVKSCGCRVGKHGWCKKRRELPEYSIWRKMIKRCTHSKAHNFARYGGRGIAVCERWMDFDNFIQDMGCRPHPALSLDRVDNDKGYSLDNCRWATAKEQANNRRKKPRGLSRRLGGKPRRRKPASKYKGVSFDKRRSKAPWYAQIRIPGGKNKRVGSFETEVEAAKAFNDAARKYHRERAYLNEVLI